MRKHIHTNPHHHFRRQRTLCSHKKDTIVEQRTLPPRRGSWGTPTLLVLLQTRGHFTLTGYDSTSTCLQTAAPGAVKAAVRNGADRNLSLLAAFLNINIPELIFLCESYMWLSRDPPAHKYRRNVFVCEFHLLYTLPIHVTCLGGAHGSATNVWMPGVSPLPLPGNHALDTGSMAEVGMIPRTRPVPVWCPPRDPAALTTSH